MTTFTTTQKDTTQAEKIRRQYLRRTFRTLLLYALLLGLGVILGTFAMNRNDGRKR